MPFLLRVFRWCMDFDLVLWTGLVGCFALYCFVVVSNLMIAREFTAAEEHTSDDISTVATPAKKLSCTLLRSNLTQKNQQK